MSAETIDEVNADCAVMSVSVLSVIAVCAETTDVNADCAADTSVSVLEIIDVLALAIASEKILSLFQLVLE